MKKEDFIRSFSGLSTVELLKILEQKENYQAVAIEVAKDILSLIESDVAKAVTLADQIVMEGRTCRLKAEL